MTNTSSAEHHEQLRHLNGSFIDNSLTRQEYDELLPFVASPAFLQSQQPQDDAACTALQAQQPCNSSAVAVISSERRSNATHRSVRFVDHVNPPEPMEAPSPYQILAPFAATSVSLGLQLRCPVCGTSNDTARGRHCYVCDSRLTITEELSATASARSLRARGRVEERWAFVAASEPRRCTFTMSEDGQIVILDGFFSCIVQDTQTIATAKGGACQVFVMCCTWRPRQATENGSQQTQATWYVSQRFSHFEKLHKALRKRLSRSATESMPPFPAKYHLIDRLEKRKQGLAEYMPRLLELCADLPNAQPVPELDEFLNVVYQIRLFLSQRPIVAAAPSLRISQRSATPTSSTPASSPFPAYADPAMLPVQSVAPPMDEMELAQAEGAVRLFAEAVRHARGDVRGDGTVQHHLDMCVQLLPSLQRSANLDNPFANAELIPRAMQCEEDLQQAVAMYNDSLLAVSGVAPPQQQIRSPEPNVHAQRVPIRNVVPASAA